MYVELMETAIVARRTLPALPFAIAAAGAAIASTHITFIHERDRAYIQAAPGFRKTALRFALWLADSFGLEVMDEEECPAEYLPGGAVRIYLARKVPALN